MKKAVFLDRDGVINKDNGYVCKPEDFHFIDGIFEFCRAAQEKGYILFVVTNQAGLARGYYSEDDYDKLTEWMLNVFTKQGIRIEMVYYCPYHPESGIGAYKQDSFDRKPNPGMILKARDEFDIDLSQSILIGDKESDMEAGRRAGVGNLIALKGKYELSCCSDVSIVCDIGQIAL